MVLEARDGPGGRVRTIRAGFDEGLYGEAGAMRIAGGQARAMQLARAHRLTLLPFGSPIGAPLIRVAGLTLRVPDGLKKAASVLRLKNDEIGLTQGQLLGRYVGELAEDLRDPAPGPDLLNRWRGDDAMTWPEWLRSRGASPGAIALMTLGGDSRDLSALYMLRQIALLAASDQFYKIEGGMDQLPRALAVAAGDRVRYGAQVVRVDHGAGAAQVEYRQRDRASVLRASHVIFAIPFAVLRRVALQPALSADKARVVADLPYFPATRFLLQTRTRFWEADDLSGSARTDDPAEIWDGAYDLPGPGGVLGATAGGAIGERLAGMSEPEALEFGVDLASKTFPPMRAEFRHGRVIRWALEPWSRGAFAVFRPGQITAWLPHLARPEGRLHFAGEHTSPWTGWMEGALESAERVVGEVLA